MKTAIQILIDKGCYQEPIPRLNIEGRIISTNVDKFEDAMKEYARHKLDEVISRAYEIEDEVPFKVMDIQDIISIKKGI